MSQRRRSESFKRKRELDNTAPEGILESDNGLEETEEDEADGNNDAAAGVLRKSKKGDLEEEEDKREWVQCNTCDKWRALPLCVDVSKLPDIWYCSLNFLDPLRKSCDAPEEEYKQSDVQMKSFLKLWVKKLRNGDRAETRLNNAVGTRGLSKKKKNDIEWIKCSSPSCGKWRAILRSIDTNPLLQRLNGNRWGSSDYVWFCSMNTWDETKASCSAPQDSLYNCAWNI